MIETFNIPDENLSTLRRKLKRLAKKAEALGLGELVSWTEGKPFEKRLQHVTPNGFRVERVVMYVPMEITTTGDIQLPGGWKLVAALDHTSADVPIINAVPDEDVPKKYRKAGSDCDHCNTNRRRNDTFIIRDENGDHKQIGRTCIADFLGHKDALALADMARYLKDFTGCGEYEDERFGGGLKNTIWDLKNCLAFVSACVRARGWVAKSAPGFPTASEAWDWFLCDFQPYTIPASRNQAAVLVEPPVVEVKDDALVLDALAWLEGESGRGDYIHNCKTIANSDRVTAKTIGIAASIIGSYKRSLEKKLVREVEAKQNGDRPSEWVGEEKERLRKLRITVLGAYETEGDYGLSTRVVFKDEVGNDFVWFASGSPDLEQGESYLVDATVKRHNEFRGKKQTQVNRVRVVG